jgi:transcriptional regulator with XRE-family HTH domain
MPPYQPDPRLITLGQSLRRIRRDRNLSQEELAARAGLHPNHIGHIERGAKDPRLTTLLRLLNALEASFAELGLVAFGGEPAARRGVDEPVADLVNRLDDARQILLDVRTAVQQGRLR